MNMHDFSMRQPRRCNQHYNNNNNATCAACTKKNKARQTPIYESDTTLASKTKIHLNADSEEE